MEKFKIPNSQIIADIVGSQPDFPKYTTQIINLANQNSQGTRPNIVGQLSDLIHEFPGSTLDEWETWYLTKHPEAIELATERVLEMISYLKSAIEKIDKQMVNEWVKDLVINKTFVGLKFQESILKQLAKRLGTSYKRSSKYEESQGIDGYLGEISVSVKPHTYESMNMLRETIYHSIVFYEKKKDGIWVSYPPELNSQV